ncbi:transmembrane protein 237-like isoform X2 [Acanthaster planci]|uniref:Transmembrane protein 237-like isoform X2 n=1 Tax=Acanthaster planci TaxID=133434 RepID=A0A8B7XGT3_ACAPL|nr:transmembrane protein 237-like isoform X2 [Acanthaster planci]
MATSVDASVKRRSLPPLLTSEPGSSSGQAQRPKKKKKKTAEGAADVSDSQQSSVSKQRTLPSEFKVDSPVMGSRENLVQNGQNGADSQAKKPRRKKKMTHGYDFESGADDTVNGEISVSTPAINNLKSSPGSSRRKKAEHRQSRLPRSVSDEVLRDNEAAGSTAKKKPRRPQSKHFADDSADDEDDAGTSKGHGRPPPPGKVKKKRKSKPPTSVDENYHADGEGMSLDIMVAAEDIISPEKQTRDEQQQQQPSHTAVLPSQPVGKLFMERKGGFKGEDKGRLARQRERELNNQQPQAETQKTTTQVALTTHRALLTFSLFCHGLLAGFALWQCVMVYILQRQVPSSDTPGKTRFLEHYSRLAQPASAMYYFLFTVCTVSVFDRFDIGRPDKQFFRGLITFQSGAISILIYLISLIMSASVAAIDDRISLFFKTTPPYCGDTCPESGSLWDSEEADAQLNIWVIINLIRAIGACLGWLVISVTPTTDYTSDHLHDAEEPLWDDQQDVELNNVHSTA